jgi:hypothetical protein
MTVHPTTLIDALKLASRASMRNGSQAEGEF